MRTILSEISPPSDLKIHYARIFDTFELFFDLEDLFDIEIQDQDIPALMTVSDLIGYVERRRKDTSSDGNP